MKAKTIAAALALAVLPGLALAECGWHKTNQSVSQCAEGYVLDAQTGSCVKLTTS